MANNAIAVTPINHQNDSIYSQQFGFTPGAARVSDQVVNNILQLIAEGNQKLRVFTTYEFHCDLYIQPSKLENNNWVLDLVVRNSRVGGDISYRHFLLDDWLIPPLLDMEVVLRQVQGENIKHLRFKDLLWQDKSYKDSALQFSFNAKTFPDEIEVEIKRISFTYPESLNQKVDLLIAALRSYYKVEQDLNSIYNLIEGIEIAAPDQVILDEFRLCEAETRIGRLRYAAFQDFPMITDTDPLGHVESIYYLRTELKKLRKEFNYVISHIDSLLHEQGITYLEKDERGKARASFERAVSYNSLYIPAQLSLALMDLEAGQSSLVLNRLAAFMGLVHPPAFWLNDIASFSQKLFENEIERAGKLADDDRFLDALRILEELDRFCLNIDVWQCPAELQQSLIDVHYGMYRSYLRVAGRAYESGNFSFAVTYIESARQYQQENSRYISSDRESISLLQDVADAYFFSADRAMLYYDYATAVKMFEEAKDLCSNYHELICRSDIDNRLAEAEIKKAEAAIFRTEYVLTEPMVILPGSGIKQAAEIVKDDLSLGHLKAWAGETDEARAILNHIIEYAIRYDLRSDSLINMRIISLTEMIHQKECELAEREVGRLLELIPDRLNNAQYIRAHQDYQQIKGLIAKQEHCVWSFADAIAGFYHIPTLAQYQEFLQESQGAYFRGAREGFDDFFHSYAHTEDFFRKNNLKIYGVDHEPLVDFVAGSSNVSLMKAAVSFFALRNEHNGAFVALQALKDNRLDAREVRTLQELAGKRAAISLSAQNPEMQPSGYARELTYNDSWYRFFVRSFISNW